MKKLVTSICIALAAVMVSACGEMVEVPPAHMGKIITKTGYMDGVIGTSKFRLEPCLAYCDKLAILQTADRKVNENLSIFMPKDKLELTASIQATLTIDPRKADELFTVIVPQETADGVVIPWESVYQTYAQQIILITAREYLSNFSINEVASNMEQINSQLGAMISKQLIEKTPFLVRNVGITSVKYPPVITDAQINAAQRREQIQQEEAQLQISQVRLERELQEARLQRQIDLEKAQGDAAAHKIQSAAVDHNVLKMRKIENERLFYERWDGKLPQTIAGSEVIELLNLRAQQ